MASPTASSTAASPAAEWRAGDVIQDIYEVRDLLGEGGMGKVYRVRHLSWNLDLAVKSPRSETLTAEACAENFVREAETWVGLGLHPHVVSCYYVRTVAGTPHVFAECVEGGSLFDWVQTGALYEGGAAKALERILDVAIQFAWGLHYAHGQGVVHQDVKTGNVMLTPGGVAKVTDFGLARARAAAGEVSARHVFPERSVVVPGAGLMTPAYASPEQAAGRPLTRRTDVWSWGASLLEMFAGGLFWSRGEFAGESLEEYLRGGAGVNGLPRMPDEVAELLRQCFNADPSRRPSSMEEVAERLSAVYARVTGGEYPRRQPHVGRGSADSLNNRALSYLDLGKQSEAEEAWQAALAADLQHPETTYNLGVLRWRRGEVSAEELIRQLESVRALHGSQWIDEYLLALVHLERGDAESAAALLEAAARQAPDSVEVRKALSLAGSSGPAPNSPLKTIGAEAGALAGAFVKPGGREALTVGADGFVRRWDVETGRPLSVVENEAFVDFASFSDEGRYVLLGSVNHKTAIRDAASGACLRRYDLSFFERLLTWWWRKNEYKTFKGWLVGGLKWTTFFIYFEGLLVGWLVLLGWLGGTAVGPGMFILTFGWPALLWLHFKGKRWGRELFIRKRAHTKLVSAAALSGDGGVLSWNSDANLNYESLTYWDGGTGRLIHTLLERTPVETTRGVEGGRTALGWIGFILKAALVILTLWFAPGLVIVYLVYNAYVRRKESENAARADAPEGVTCVAIRADGLCGVAGGVAGGVRVYDLRSGQQRQTFKGHGGAVGAVCLSPDGRYAVSGSADGAVRLWDIASGGCSRILQGHEGGVSCVAFSKDGRHVVSGGKDEVVRLWDVATACCLRTYVGHAGGVTSVGFGEGGEVVASSGEDGTMRLWRVPGGGVEAFPLQVSRVRATEELIETEGRAGDLLKRAETAVSGARYADALALAEESRRTPGFERARENRDQWERLSLHCRRGRLRGAWLVRAFAAQGGAVSCGCLTGDGLLVVSGSADASGGEETLHLWDASTGERLQSIRFPEAVTAACVSADGRYSLTGSEDGSPRLWDLQSGRHVRTFWGHVGAVNAVCLSDDGRYAASAGVDKSLRLWDVSDGRCLRTIVSRDSGPLRAVALSDCGRHALTGGASGAIRLWELRTGRCALELPARERLVNSVCLSSDGRRALTGGGDGALRLWALEGGECLRTLAGHEGAVTSVGLTGDGRFAVSGGTDGQVRLWELESGACVQVLEGHAGGVISVGLSDSGRYVLSAGNDKSLRLWELDWGLEACPPTDWDEGARPHLENFLYRHSPAAGDLNEDGDTLSEEVERALTPAGPPVWDEEDFQTLLRRLQVVGYGWLPPEGVRRKLLETAAAAAGGEAEAVGVWARARGYAAALPGYYRRHRRGFRAALLLLVLAGVCAAALWLCLTLFYHLRNDAVPSNSNANTADARTAVPGSFTGEHWCRYTVGETRVSLELPSPPERLAVEVPKDGGKLEAYVSYANEAEFMTEVRRLVMPGRLKMSVREVYDGWKQGMEANGGSNLSFETRPDGRGALRIHGRFDAGGRSRLGDGLLIVEGSEVRLVFVVRQKTWRVQTDAEAEEAARRIVDSVQY